MSDKQEPRKPNFGKFTLVLIGIVLAGFFVHYGTLSPCGMLKKDIRSELLETAFDSDTSSPFGLAGSALGASLGGAFIDNIIESLTPLQCTKGLFNRYTSGDYALSDYMRNSDFSSKSSTKSTPSITSHDYGTPDVIDFPPTWNSSSNTSPIDDSTNVYLSLDSEDKIRGSFSSKTPSLHIRCKENKTESYVNAGTMLDYDFSRGTTKVTLRWDKQKAYTTYQGISTDHDAFFFSNRIGTVKKMLEHDLLTVQVTPYNKGSQAFTFNLTGFDEVLSPLREACHWTDSDLKKASEKRAANETKAERLERNKIKYASIKTSLFQDCRDKSGNISGCADLLESCLSTILSKEKLETCMKNGTNSL